jgi:hypothetical protein
MHSAHSRVDASLRFSKRALKSRRSGGILISGRICHAGPFTDQAQLDIRAEFVVQS